MAHRFTLFGLLARLLLAVFTALAVAGLLYGAVPPQAPRPPQAPPVREEPQPAKPKKACDCSAECSCGCNEGRPCAPTCGPIPGAGSALRGIATSPLFPAPAYFAAPAPIMGAMRSNGGC